MADKSFGVKELNILGSGTPSIDSQGDLNLNANKVAISTDFTVGGASTVTGNSFVGSAISMYAATGIVSATKFCGDGSGLTNAGGFTPDAQENLYAGTNAGASSDADTCFNVAIGYSAGTSNSAGDHNVFIGSYTGCKVTNTSNNVAIGKSALTCSFGSNNVAIGYHAGMKTGSGYANVLLGTQAGCEMTSGNANVILGRFAAKKITSGLSNFLGGYAVGCCILTGGHNVALGAYALQQEGTGASCFNIALGYGALRNMQSGGCNFAVGREAGLQLASGVDNIFIGRCANSCGGAQNRLIMIGWSVKPTNNSGSDQFAVGCDTSRWLRGDNSFNLCLGNSTAIKAMANGNFYATAFYGDGSNLTGISGGGSGGCLKLVADRNYVSDGSCSGCSISGGADNILIGTCAGKDTSSGTHNILIGTCAGEANTDAVGAVILGRCAGGANGIDNNVVIIGTEANRCGGATSNNSGNVLIGYQAGYKTAYHSQIAIGSKAAYNTCGSGGWTNTVIGYCAAYSNTSGQGSVFVGPYAGQCIASGNYNAIFGQKAGRTIDAGGNNAIFGANAGSCFNSGSSGNTFIGKYAARCQTGGSTNVAIGCDARLESSTGSNQLSIGLGANYWLRGDSSYNIRPGAGIEDCDGATGSSGQVLSSTGSYVKWVASGGGGGSGGCLKLVADRNYVSDGSCSGCSISGGTDNILLGTCAGKCNTSGDYNIYLGQYAGERATTVSNNVVIGRYVGCKLASGGNVILGSSSFSAGAHTGSYNVILGGSNFNQGCVSTNGCQISIGYYSNYYSGGTACKSIAIGTRALMCNWGDRNIAIGEVALSSKTGSGVGSTSLTGSNNVAIGPEYALYAVTTGLENIAIGQRTGMCVTSGCYNISLGCMAGSGDAGSNYGTGNDNVSIGNKAGSQLSSGANNIALGKHAGCAITTGSSNVLMGFNAGPKITTGNGNTFIGGGAGKYTDSSSYSVFIGCTAGHNSEGDHVIAIGYYAGHGGGTKTGSVFIGSHAGDEATGATCTIHIGYKAACNATSANRNIFIGDNLATTLTTGDCNILIGSQMDVASSSTSTTLEIGCGTNRWISGDSSFNIKPGAGILDCDGATGSSGQVLSSTGSYVKWVASGGGGSGGCLKLIADGNYISDGSCSGCSSTFSDTDDNIFVGRCAGKNTGTSTGGCAGHSNIFLGKNAGLANTTGCYNISMGFESSYCNDCGHYNVVMGYKAHRGLTQYSFGPYGCNVVLGYCAGGANYNGNGYMHDSVFIGANAGKGVGSVEWSTAVGCEAFCTGGGNHVAAFGASALKCGGDQAVGVGGYAGCIGSHPGSIFIGMCSGYCMSASGSCCNIIIGHGRPNCHGSMANWCGRDVILIGNSIQPPLTGGNCPTQLGIGVTTNYWITGDSSFNIKPGRGITDCDGATGTSGQVLSSTGGAYVKWVASGGGGGSGGCLKLDDDDNLYSDGTCSGCNFDGTNACGNLLLGQCAGKAITTGGCNIALGFCALATNTVGYCNIAIGAHAGANSMPNATCTGQENIFIGHRAGYNANTVQYSCANIAIGACAGYKAAYNCNVFMGNNAGKCNANFSNVLIGQDAGCAVTGSYNIMFGRSAGKTGGSGGCNIGIGFCALYAFSSGCDNVAIGACNTLKSLNNGHHNIALGKAAGACITYGQCNIIFGCCAARTLTTGCNNVAIGVSVEPASATGNCQFIIGMGPNHWICGDSSFNIYDKDGNQLNGGGGGSGGCLKLVETTNLVSDGVCAGCNITSEGEDNILLGRCAGRCITNGDDNIIIGQQAGNCLVCGSMNILIGKCAGYGTTISGCSGAGCNVIIGMGAAKCGNDSNFSANVIIGCEAARTYCYNSLLAIGSRAAYSMTGTNGWMNTVVGTCAAYCSNNSTQSSTYVGSRAGKFITSGNYNAFFGWESYGNATSGQNNTILGARAGRCITGGESGNTFVGKYAARLSTAGDNNVAIGCDIQLPSTTGDNQMAIGIGANKWIYGDSSYNIYDKDGNQLNGGGGAGFSPDSQGNLYAGTSAGACSDSDTLCNIAIGECAGCKLDAGDFNVFLGLNAGRETTTGKTNFFGGYSAGRCNLSGCYNVIFGLGAGKCGTAGNSRVFIGQGAGEKSCANHNYFIGYYAGCTAGVGGAGGYNIAFGYAAGRNHTTGYNNVYIGCNAGCTSAAAQHNVVVGSNAGRNITTNGSCNVIAGYETGCANTTGCENVYFGRQAGKTDQTGYRNVYIGMTAGRIQASGRHDNVFIGNGAGRYSTSTNNSVFVGCYAGIKASGSDNSVFIGTKAGAGCSDGSTCATGDNTIAIGMCAGYNLTTGASNIFLGSCAGDSVTTGGSNVVIGPNADVASATGSAQLVIGCGSSNWITGDSSYNVVIGGCVQATSAASSANGHRKITTSTSAPSGGSDGDIWIKYTA